MGDTTLAGVTDDPIDDVVATAALHRRRFELAEAEKALRAALAQAPGSMAARILLGRVLLDTHREPLALAEFEEAARLHPDAPSRSPGVSPPSHGHGDMRTPPAWAGVPATCSPRAPRSGRPWAGSPSTRISRSTHSPIWSRRRPCGPMI